MRYIGNKRKLTEQLVNNIGSCDVVADLFAGSGVVTEALVNSNNYKKIITNDLMYYSHVITSGKIQPKKIKNIQNVLTQLNNTSIGGWITDNYSTNRMYFTKENAKLIDGARITLDTIVGLTKEEYNYYLYCLLDAVMGVSNTTGTYGAYLKKWDSRALKPFVIKELPYKISKKIEFHNTDIETLLTKISGDVLYLDPPYTSIDYSSAYHVLESIALYDKPLIKGITGQRVDNSKRNKLTKKTKAYKTLFNIINTATFDKIVMSYSNHGILTLEQIIEIGSQAGYDVSTEEIEYRVYKNINKTEKKQLLEYIITFKKSITKNPMNYAGNKINIIDGLSQLINASNVTNFVDVFTGGVNVPINISSNFNVIANDINDKVIKMYKDMQVEGFVDSVDSYQVGDYYDLRNDYNTKPTSVKLFLLCIYGFNSQIRFNNSGKFNNPVGLNKWNELKRTQLITFIEKIRNIEFTTMDYKELIKRESNREDVIFYLDPPYLITTASYNDGKRGFKGWDEEIEKELLETIDKYIVSKGKKFILSNVIEHKGRTNTILKKWVEKNGFNMKQLPNKKREEVVIYNYESEI